MDVTSIEKAQKAIRKALIWFICILMLVLAFAIGNCAAGSGDNASVLFVGIFLMIIPFLISFVFACKARKQINLCKRNNLAIPRNLNILSIVLMCQIPLFLLLLIGSSIIKPVVAVKRVEAYISDKYDENYEVLESCHHFDESVNDYTEVIFKLSGFDQPIIARYNWRSNKYQDNYNELLSGKDSSIEPGC